MVVMIAFWLLSLLLWLRIEFGVQCFANNFVACGLVVGVIAVGINRLFRSARDVEMQVEENIGRWSRMKRRLLDLSVGLGVLITVGVLLWSECRVRSL